MPISFDVVTVPDFRPGIRPDFETRALFFLAGWVECGGAAAGIPLHMVCIGDPPDSVRRLADEAGASLTVRDAIDAEKRNTSNKIRGLEVESDADQILLVDTDILFLDDPSSLAGLGRCVAVAPVVGPKIPASLWRRIYEEAGMDPPAEKILSVRAETECPAPSRHGRGVPVRDSSGIHPEFNGGTVWVPRDVGLGPLWEKSIRMGAGCVDPDMSETAILGLTDEVGLALAVETLRRRGTDVRILPAPFRATWLHLYRRSLPFDEIALFHAFRFAESANGSTRRARGALHGYRKLLTAGFFAESWRQDVSRGRPLRALRDLPGALSDALRLGRRMDRMLDRLDRVLPGAGSIGQA